MNGSTDVVELQRQRILYLEKTVSDVTTEIGKLFETVSNLSHVLSYLTDDKFKAFASQDNWNKVIVDYLENSPNS